MTQFEDDEAYLTGGDDGGVGAQGDAPAGRRPRMEPHRGALILVLGILGLIVCPFTGPFAWMMGGEDLGKMRAGRMDPEGEGLTQAGRILGIIVTGLMLLGILGFVAFMVLAMFASGSAVSSTGG